MLEPYTRTLYTYGHGRYFVRIVSHGRYGSMVGYVVPLAMIFGGIVLILLARYTTVQGLLEGIGFSISVATLLYVAARC